MRLARAWSTPASEHERLYARLFTLAAKFGICKAGIPFVVEATEVLGGIGYCEESELQRLYREMPVNSIWEGSGNVMCLDVMCVLGRHTDVLTMLDDEFDAVKGITVILIAAGVNFGCSCPMPERGLRAK